LIYFYPKAIKKEKGKVLSFPFSFFMIDDAILKITTSGDNTTNQVT
jgi:hypothetical protein